MAVFTPRPRGKAAASKSSTGDDVAGRLGNGQPIPTPGTLWFAGQRGAPLAIRLVQHPKKGSSWISVQENLGKGLG
jgi:hypothetical protein